MFVDIISYKLAEGISEDFLREAAADILEVWMKKQEGFVGWEIGKSEDGYIDFVYWQDKVAAEKATARMKDIPTDHAWMKCYQMSSIQSKKVESLYSFKNSSS